MTTEDQTRHGIALVTTFACVVTGSATGLKDLPYNIGEPYSFAWGSWSHCRGTSKIIIWWAGLMRGAVSVALAYNQFTRAGHTHLCDNAIVITSTITVVLFSTMASPVLFVDMSSVAAGMYQTLLMCSARYSILEFSYVFFEKTLRFGSARYSILEFSYVSFEKTLRFGSVLQNISDSIVALVTKEGRDGI